jgi:hypothetical protein
MYLHESVDLTQLKKGLAPGTLLEEADRQWLQVVVVIADSGLT